MKFLDYIKGCKTALIISSRPLDFDCIASGLILKKYLESLNLKVELRFPTKIKKSEQEFNRFLPYFKEVKDEDTRKILSKENFDVLILVDGSNLAQFYDANLTSNYPPNLNLYQKRIHIDHHPLAENLGILEIRDQKASATAEIILTQIVPKSFIDKNIATLGYAALIGDTGNFSWNFTSQTLKLAAFLVEKEAKADEIIFKLNAKPKEYFEVFKYVLDNAVFDDKLKTIFFFLSFEKLQKDQLTEEKLDIAKRIFQGPISKSIEDYPRGFMVYESNKGVVGITARGNNLTNKINLPEILSKLNGSSGGHFNACGGKFEGDFEKIKQSLLENLRVKI